VTFAHRYTVRQREVIADLAERGKTSREIAELCKEGVEGLDPFEPPRETVTRIIREERQKTGKPRKGKLRDRLRRTADRAIDLVELQLDKLEEQIEDGEPPDIDKLKATLATLEQLERFTRKIGEIESENGNTEKPEGLLERLASE
jgi:DNA-binding transcriptional MerR regulator